VLPPVSGPIFHHAAAAARIAPLGWQLQMFVSPDAIVAIAPVVRRLRHPLNG
jgi:hypothetical protein